MKKIIIVFIVMFATLTMCSCKNAVQEISKETTKNSLPVLTATRNTHNVSSNTPTDATSSTTQSTTINTQIQSTDTQESSAGLQHTPPYILTESVEDLRRIKKATQTVDESEFEDYMKNNFSTEAVNKMDSLENTKAILDELESSYAVVLDDKQNDLNFAFYVDSHLFHQIVFFDEQRRIAANVHTPENNKPKTPNFEENSVLETISLEEYGYDGNIYVIEGSEHFFADIIIEESYILIRSHGIETLEDFENCFSRLSFVKIGDLIEG